MHHISIGNFIGNAITEHELRRIETSRFLTAFEMTSQMLRMARNDKKPLMIEWFFLLILTAIYPNTARRVCPTTANANNS